MWSFWCGWHDWTLQQQCCPLDREWFGGKKYSILNLLMGKPWKFNGDYFCIYFGVSLVHVCAFFVSAFRCSLWISLLLCRHHVYNILFVVYLYVPGQNFGCSLSLWYNEVVFGCWNSVSLQEVTLGILCWWMCVTANYCAGNGAFKNVETCVRDGAAVGIYWQLGGVIVTDILKNHLSSFHMFHKERITWMIQI